MLLTERAENLVSAAMRGAINVVTSPTIVVGGLDLKEPSARMLYSTLNGKNTRKASVSCCTEGYCTVR